MVKMGISTVIEMFGEHLSAAARGPEGDSQREGGENLLLTRK
jgi:hypothetical protein